jgi:uncharacterized membrane protein (UPF0136 family)
MTPSLILWIYIALLIAGGLMGLIKAGSKISLIASVACAVPLVLVILGKLPMPVAWVVIGLLGGMFTARFIRNRKPMPAIPMIVASAVALALLLTLGR